MGNPLISIAVPVYNGEQTVDAAVASCVNQDANEHYEVLLVDNCSNDGTVEIFEKYTNHPNVRLLVNRETVSVYDNHNICLQEASGKYVVFCHADDTLEKHALRTFSKRLRDRGCPEKYVLWGRSMYRDYFKYLRNAGESLNQLIVGEVAPLIFMNSGLAPSGCCYSRVSFLEHGGFLVPQNRLAPSDMVTMLSLAVNGFRFEMFDEMVLGRTFASTAVSGLSVSTLLDAMDEAIDLFISATDESTVERLIHLCVGNRIHAYSFLHALARYKRYKRAVRKAVIKSVLEHPGHIRIEIFRRLAYRAFSS